MCRVIECVVSGDKKMLCVCVCVRVRACVCMCVCVCVCWFGDISAVLHYCENGCMLNFRVYAMQELMSAISSSIPPSVVVQAT